MKNNNSLFYTCSLIEFIGRQQKLERSVVVQTLGSTTLKRIYNYADIFHCEPIESVAYNFIEMNNIPMGDFDNELKCQYDVPDYWIIGEVYERLIEDICEERKSEDYIGVLQEVYTSWIDSIISNYNRDFYYQSREYIVECYRASMILN